MIIIWDEDELAFRIKEKCDYTFFELRPCIDPFCGCLQGTLLFFKSIKDDSEIGLPVQVDLESKSWTATPFEENEEFEEAADKEYLRNFIVKNFDDSDWSLLTVKFIEDKQEYVENFDVKETHLFRPSYEVFEQEHPVRLIKYRDVFPYYKQFEVVFDDTLYKVDEFYCLRKNCECDTVNLVLTSQDGQTLNCEYNFAKDQIKSSDFEFVDEFIHKLKDMMLSLEHAFRLRELQLIYIDAEIELSIKKGILALAAEEGLLDKLQPIVNGEKIGRNEPCPCGSGKKYKKCCMLN